MDRNRNEQDPIPSMSTDNTSTSSNERLNEVREGMEVVDSANEKLGSVEFIAMGDPTASTVDSNVDRDMGILGDVARAFGAETEPGVPEPLRSRLLRVGYIKVDGKGWIDTDFYITANQIASVSNQVVRLSSLKDELITDKA